ncbi:uncharacterized protein LOC143544032 [Bidens hawaiensis]|uniref:uncharacterized protein LOC143544032 n=1 Tax=Bidens hawaiensis TaxID=980011 RepID=UPI00404A391D
MGDDDTVFFLENLVDVLRKYDHNGYYYVGMNAESIISNTQFSFGMGFGGAGFAFSYPLANILAKNLDVCLKRYKDLHGSDHILQSCVADLGVSVTHVKGFHQIDLHGDISGLLSAHPQAPLVSLHHLDMVEPLFPGMDRIRSLNHLMKPAEVDQSRLLQQSTDTDIFRMASRSPPPFMLNTRGLSKNPCDIPHYFYFDSVDEYPGGEGKQRQVVVTSYVRRFPRWQPPCVPGGNYSVNYVEKILVISPATRLETEGSRRECCDVVYADKENVTTINIRPCMKYEIMG